ncbi:RdgB/HAM1 family non-canonical purine NTP pyrophosphatase [Brachybacterium sp. EE-P12]|uniref:dITP/XTP pyrophosphatase n=1 Tax=Candidatus Brachybacterium intestinipullorum TaxID=2838512 RepID=A0A9D2TID5_9MICO|nr:RdgB/HAM1 family non-canonical purine NTP pyrophosphatase [Brachybacterium sp. EE-P12]HJC69913.1 RdgB/HAM1 family non-canonical purine NTP pyrophosphatase [Candidatus Brachybacterium intestinipullorum]
MSAGADGPSAGDQDGASCDVQHGATAAVPTGARVILASHNVKKLRELQRILAAAVPGLDPEQVISSAGIALPDVVEDEVSFAGNALLKARSAAAATGLLAVADDSGLAVDVLGGSPGIFSARWSGRHGDDEANNDLLLAQLSDVPDQHRGARFVCAAALVAPDGTELVEHGEMTGMLLRERHGGGGFGYDPLFRPDGQTRSAAELTPEEKDAISHRGTAFRAIAPHVARLLG